MNNWLKNTTANLTTGEISENVTAVRMKSELLSVLPMILIRKKIIA